MTLRDIDSYPEQEPLSEIGGKYHVRCQELGAGVEGEVFAYGDDPYQEVAVFPAEKPDGRVLAFMHGGGWTNGYKEWMAFMAPAANARGITFVSVGYRLAPRVTWPTGVEDAAYAIGWIYGNIAEHGGDPDRIVVGGHSAGGHYAMWLAVREDWQADAGVPPDVICGAVPVSGVYDFTEGNGMPMRPRFLGDDPSNERDASPEHTIARTPPALISWGDSDFPHLISQAERMVTVYRNAGADVETLLLEGCDHLGASYACGEPDGIWIAAVDDWMARNQA
ncbi:MAG: alpha/beta hydrolase [Alphaproteobacteria bacterium]|nr:alpha/beta hydrolase [Alphaproteobacteria bacterium]